MHTGCNFLRLHCPYSNTHQRQLLDVVSPSNFPLTNPDILATTQAQGGANFWHGMLNWLDAHSSGKTKPPSMGSKEYAAIQEAPGSYVMMK